ncbi:MAG: lysophospholipid acyltransferase family protein [Desulfobacterales bacterium]|nr:lysophospholipid acyltransferase family protein [Desulfobacterales bacterium]
MRIDTKALLRSKHFARFVYRFIRIYSRTFRVSVINEKPWRDYLANGGRVLICSWHQQFFSFIRHFQTYKAYQPCLMISQSADGQLIANVANFSGWHTVRGSSSKDGGVALAKIIERLKETGLAAHILDGPKGPAGIIKRGAVQIAMEAGAMIVPVYAEADAKWIFNSWDRFFVPKPFARLTIRYGDMVPPPDPAADADGIEAHRKALETLMRPALAA